MMIQKVKLVNFISHRDTEIELPHGLTAIIGRNGAGKTSILDAISYALFKQHSRGKDENLINRRASSAQVQLQFNSNGRSYEITWRIERDKRARATLKNVETGSPILIDAGERTVIPEIERILGISREIFLNAAYLRQGEIARLLEARPAERKELISKLLGIDALEKIWEILRTPIKVLEEKLERLREEAGRRPDLEERIRDISSKLSESEKLLRGKELKLKKLEEKLAETERKLKRLEEERTRAEGLREAVLKLEKLINRRREELNGAERELELVEKAEKRVSELKGIVEEKNRLESEIEEIRGTISEMKIMKDKEEMVKRRAAEISEEISSLKGFLKNSLKTLEKYLQLEMIDEDEFAERLSAALEEYNRIRNGLRDKIQRLVE
ncbi:MAG: AAA family ATPase [Thaumarchaeota archaeon]|nr:AAA family ATPase [Nitrososphaerota archaeon]